MKKKNTKHGFNEEVSYWQSSADVLAALLMVILLIMMILLLYLVSIPENDQIDPSIGDQTSTAQAEEESTDPHWWDEHDKTNAYDATENTHEGWDDPDHGGGGGNGGDGPAPGIYDGTGPGDGLGKTAVYVMVVDEDTHNTIKEEGITFELHIYNDQKKVWQLAVLNTYYPVEIEYRNYQTTVEGIFFLPEKVYLGQYKFHQLTAPYGYDLREDFEFPVDEARDWNEPIIVTIPLSPSKNIIRIQMNDQETKEPLTDGTFYVVASEDIITLDGTIRYKKGEIVDEITCDENGYGESIELYLGNYELQQHTIPEFYAAESTPIPVEVKKKVSGVLPKLNQIYSQKTAFTVSVKDELYANIPIKDGRFSISYYLGNQRTDYINTDEFGEIKLTNLAKSTTYHVKQLSTMDGYSMSPIELEIVVDANGRIDGEVTPVYELSNRLLRAKFSVRDIMLKSIVSDMNVTLFDEAGTVISSWDSTGMANLIEGLPAGNYYLIINGRENTKKKITILDNKDIQEFSVSVWTNKSIVALVLFIVFILVALILWIWYLIHFKEERKRKKAERKVKRAEKKEEKRKKKELQKEEQERKREQADDKKAEARMKRQEEKRRKKDLK